MVFKKKTNGGCDGGMVFEDGGAMVGVGYAAAVTMTMVAWRYGDDGGDDLDVGVVMVSWRRGCMASAMAVAGNTRRKSFSAGKVERSMRCG
ncbi:hypothetical protein Tco_0973597 [Tanacetum coccineum]